MKVFVTGGAGFVGQSVVSALILRGHVIHALVNRNPLNREAVRSFPGGLFDDQALDAGMLGCDAVVHLVGIIAEKPSQGITFDRIHYQGTRKVVDAARRAHVGRYLQMSALGAAPHARSSYHRSKFAAEEYLGQSQLNWTIFQPSLIHGPGGDFSRLEAGWARGTAIPFLFMPYFGRGLMGRGELSKVQPVFVEDVARAFADALEGTKTIGEIYQIGGPDQMTWPRMHRIAAEVLTGRSRPAVAIPAWYAKAIARLVPPFLLPFTRDQVLMSEQHNICDLNKFIADFGWMPRPFEQTLRGYKTEF